MQHREIGHFHRLLCLSITHEVLILRLVLMLLLVSFYRDLCGAVAAQTEYG